LAIARKHRTVRFLELFGVQKGVMSTASDPNEVSDPHETTAEDAEVQPGQLPKCVTEAGKNGVYVLSSEVGFQHHLQQRAGPGSSVPSAGAGDSCCKFIGPTYRHVAREFLSASVASCRF